MSAPLGEVIERARVAAGLGLRQLSERLGCSPTYLSLIERGRNQGAPSAALLEAMARILHVSADELMWLARRIPDDIIGALLTHRELWDVVRDAARRAGR
jgi:transcriptional regulator with XRE-family HTH domain